MTTLLNKDKGSPSLYFQVMEKLKEEIEDGTYKYGEIIPGENRLCEMFNVSRITIRQALQELSRTGHVQPQRGIGTKVIWRQVSEIPGRIISFSEEMKLHGMEMTTSYCSIERTVPSKKIASELEIQEGDECLLLERTRDVDGRPLVHSCTFIPLFWGLDEDETLYRKSFYEYLRREKHISVCNATDTFSAVLADRQIASRLGLQEPAAVLKRIRKSWSSDDRVMEYTICWYQADRYRYTIEK